MCDRKEMHHYSLFQKHQRLGQLCKTQLSKGNPLLPISSTGCIKNVLIKQYTNNLLNRIKMSDLTIRMLLVSFE